MDDTGKSCSTVQKIFLSAVTAGFLGKIGEVSFPKIFLM